MAEDRPLSDRDAEIRKLAPFVQRVTHCKREVAIGFLCSLSRFERTVLHKLRAVERLNKKPRRAVPRNFPTDTHRPALEAWSKPR